MFSPVLERKHIDKENNSFIIQSRLNAMSTTLFLLLSSPPKTVHNLFLRSVSLIFIFHRTDALRWNIQEPGFVGPCYLGCSIGRTINWRRGRVGDLQSVPCSSMIILTFVIRKAAEAVAIP